MLHYFDDYAILRLDIFLKLVNISDITQIVDYEDNVRVLSLVRHDVIVDLRYY